MADMIIPDRVSIDAKSPYFWPYFKKVGVKFDGLVIFNATEFCVSEGWVCRSLRDKFGRLKLERGRAVSVRYNGKVETYWRE
jgi:hypothetical protein